jgi:anti-anti-sigma factor
LLSQIDFGGCVQAVGTVRVYRPDQQATNESQRCGRASLSVRRTSPTRVAVAVVGELDGVNVRALGRFVERHTGVSKQLVLDLRAVDFLGVQAFTALYYISVHCARNDVDWIIVGSHPVRHVLSICDAGGELPLVEDLASALGRLDRLARCRHAPAS